ncbi:hypothetical protein [uncultured Stenotrophomonas sp.]|uniref:hypothetical protein n=1 Tax=uncultured Stenotrophomonas sp. TaxID=165438 RepID=UPI0018D3624D|nr:hypothetical protein [uncultured Stenotrophomonas sp.]MBH1605137.1 hypothetical protein [Stenotrophomonas maltophilia]MBH1669128.1 hypothetical protein [Stenotrophomonas maltophilia]
MAFADAEKTLIAQYVEAEQKHAYFLLGATGAAVGFVVQKLDGQRFDLPGSVLLIAAGSLLLSLLLGIRFLDHANRARHANVKWLQLQKEFKPQDAKQKKAYDALVSKLDAKIDTENAKAGSCKMWQFRALFLGALLLVAWRVFTMLALS